MEREPLDQLFSEAHEELKNAKPRSEIRLGELKNSERETEIITMLFELADEAFLSEDFEKRYITTHQAGSAPLPATAELTAALTEAKRVTNLSGEIRLGELQRLKAAATVITKRRAAPAGRRLLAGSIDLFLHATISIAVALLFFLEPNSPLIDQLISGNIATYSTSRFFASALPLIWLTCLFAPTIWVAFRRETPGMKCADLSLVDYAGGETNALRRINWGLLQPLNLLSLPILAIFRRLPTYAERAAGVRILTEP